MPLAAGPAQYRAGGPGGPLLNHCPSCCPLQGLTGQIPEGGDLCKLVEVSSVGPSWLGVPCSCAKRGERTACLHSHSPFLLPPCLQSSLESLQLGGTGVSGELPSCLFGGQSKLYLLSLRATRLGGAIPDAFATATRLQVLDLGYVRGSSSLQLFGSCALPVLRVPPCRKESAQFRTILTVSFLTGLPHAVITDAAVAALPAVPQNKLSGSIPASLASAPSLSILDLSFNALTMDIPALGANKLAALSLAGNKLTGVVPQELAAHPVLTRLDLADNLLTALPQAWTARPAAGGGEAPPLAQLRLSGNQLSGGFPVGLAAYASLEALELDGNRLRQALHAEA